MNNSNNQEYGFDTIRQLEMAVKAAQRIVGQATMSMDEEQLQAAAEALQQAKMQYDDSSRKLNAEEHASFTTSSNLINKLEQQLSQAKRQ